MPRPQTQSFFCLERTLGPLISMGQMSLEYRGLLENMFLKKLVGRHPRKSNCPRKEGKNASNPGPVTRGLPRMPKKATLTTVKSKSDGPNAAFTTLEMVPMIDICPGLVKDPVDETIETMGNDTTSISLKVELTGFKKSSDPSTTVLIMGNISGKTVNGTIDMIAMSVVKVYSCNRCLAATVALINDVSGVIVKNTGSPTNRKHTHPALTR